MADQITLVAGVESFPAGFSPYEIRPVEPADREALGRLYFESYDPGIACDTLAEAIDDIQASFDGEYGRLLEDASVVAIDGSVLVGAVLTVHRPPWEGLADCPLIIELFVDRGHRRRGIGKHLIERVVKSLAESGEHQVSLRMAVDNRPALALYDSLGFVRWSPDGAR